jgi:predicted nucleotidyltransferase
LGRCLEAMNSTMPLRRVILFGSHARGDARSDSDVDLCLVADGAERQEVTMLAQIVRARLAGQSS